MTTTSGAEAPFDTTDTITEPEVLSTGPLEVLGTLYAEQEPVPEGQEPPPPTPLPGWHVNAPWPIPGWDAWHVTPSQPRRVFGGGTTVHYTFPDQATYQAALEAADLTEPPPPPKVPSAITMRQARLALLQLGKLAAVDTALASLPEPTRSAAKIEWEYSAEVYRHKALVLSLAPALGLSAAHLDAMFIAAAAL